MPRRGSETPMITASPLRAQPRAWQTLWREAITDPRELLQSLDLSHLIEQLFPARDAGFTLRVPRGFVARMRRADPTDPLLLQVLPQAAELEDFAGFTQDAVGDLAARAERGVLHKYQGRALLIATGACAVHCRYCFRRHFPYAEETAATDRWRTAIEHIRADVSIAEVILSGGDPLSLSTQKLAELTQELRSIPHVQRLRIHTRLPIVLPERVDAELVAWLRSLPWPVAIVLHANHANEIDDAVANTCARLRATGTSLLNQSVLLRGVNDNVQALTDLSVRLFEAGVLPYYLHQLDRVAGAAHFAVEDERARELVDHLRGSLSGYLVPRLVREVTGEPGKTPL